MEEDRVLWVNVRFVGNQVDEFERVQADLGIDARTEVIRYLIAQHLKRMAERVVAAERTGR